MDDPKKLDQQHIDPNYVGDRAAESPVATGDTFAGNPPGWNGEADTLVDRSANIGYGDDTAAGDLLGDTSKTP